jgi:hypothetical protein
VNTKPLSMYLDALANAGQTMGLSEADQAAVRHTADVIRNQPVPWMVVLVAGRDADPVAEEVESISHTIDRLYSKLADLDSRAVELLTAVRSRAAEGVAP